MNEKIRNLLEGGEVEIQYMTEKEYYITEEERIKYEMRIGRWKGMFLTTTDQQILKYTFFIFKKANMSSILKIDEKCIWVFIRTVLYYYLPNPYHNSKHAMEVLHSGYIIYNLISKYNTCSNIQVISLILAFFLHDVGHLGIPSKQLYHEHELLRNMFSEKSLSENLHFFIAKKILLDERIGLFTNLTESEKNISLSVIKDCILATDLQNQKQILQNFNEKYFECELPGKYNKRNNKLKEIKNEEMLMIIKIADLSNLAKGSMISIISSLSVNEEIHPDKIINFFFEKDFIKKTVLPLYKCFALVFEEFNPIYKKCLKNYKSYKNFCKRIHK
ncbi:cAMP-specific 3',5'-cyclic phosphodiesterase [Astathelohania contejeani]|uniref:cAMP-specific 3',5'-cyclic phosphodiesterase n=1 Tax=Astathelohania contejeani TaxID=164912 RepID=A0ABQ7HYX9_9MICR|nr:cAMP-specific 3',5'-cyclic phosphodiesterase [Thelohania contejeani]